MTDDGCYLRVGHFNSRCSDSSSRVHCQLIGLLSPYYVVHLMG